MAVEVGAARAGEAEQASELGAPGVAGQRRENIATSGRQQQRGLVGRRSQGRSSHGGGGGGRGGRVPENYLHNCAPLLIAENDIDGGLAPRRDPWAACRRPGSELTLTLPTQY